MDVNAVCAAIATAAGSAQSTPALTATGFLPDAVTEPHFMVVEPVIDYDKTFGRTAEMDLMCRLLVSRSDDQSSQELLRKYISTGNPESVKDAIEAARGGPGQAALGGLVDDLWVRRVERPRWYEHAGYEFVGVDLHIKVVE